MEIAKSELEKEIATIFRKHTKKGREGEAAGVINGLLPAYFRQLQTGNFSEKYPTTGYMQKEENKDKAHDFIQGFLWAMDAAGFISEDERRTMLDQLTALRFPRHSEAYYEAAAQEMISSAADRAAKQ
ncbi:MAG: hypothetical protein NC548_26605 [Lachnospiraceae bacterium]|nr:hypothetical protein [Lachnospiraceae bacterium]